MCVMSQFWWAARAAINGSVPPAIFLIINPKNEQIFTERNNRHSSLRFHWRCKGPCLGLEFMQFFLPEKCDDAIQSVPSVSHLVNTIFFPTGKKQAFKKIYPPKFKS